MADNKNILLLKNESSIDSFNQLYEEWSGKLYGFILKMANGDTYLAEEITQNVFVAVWEQRALLDENKSFGALLCTIAKDKLINVYNHRIIENLYAKVVAQNPAADINQTEDDVDYHFLNDFVNQIVDRLPSARRTIFTLSRRQNLTNKEIAEKLNISENTVISQLQKALIFIKKQIEEHYSYIIITSLFLFQQVP